MKLHIDKQSYLKKPDNVATVKFKLQNDNTIVDVDMKTIATAIHRGQTISPSVLIGGRGAKNWTEQQLFLVDIDNNEEGTQHLTLEGAFKICNENNLIPCLCYFTFSYTEQKPKYRIGFCMSEVITEEGTRKKIIDTLINLFPQSDKSCVNADRLFFGSNKKVIFYNYETVNIDSILTLYKEPEPKQVQVQDLKTVHTTPPKGTLYPLSDIISNFDLLSYIEATTGTRAKKKGKDFVINPNPLNGHPRDSFYIDVSKNQKETL
jgi:hypothetical protein